QLTGCGSTPPASTVERDRKHTLFTRHYQWKHVWTRGGRGASATEAETPRASAERPESLPRRTPTGYLAVNRYISRRSPSQPRCRRGTAPLAVTRRLAGEAHDRQVQATAPGPEAPRGARGTHGPPRHHGGRGRQRRGVVRLRHLLLSGRGRTGPGVLPGGRGMGRGLHPRRVRRRVRHATAGR